MWFYPILMKILGFCMSLVGFTAALEGRIRALDMAL